MTRSTASRGTRTAAARSWWCNLASEVVAELRPRIQEIEKLGDNARRYRVIETFGQLLKGGTGILLQAVEPGGMTMTVTTSRDSARANEQLVVEAELKPDNKTFGWFGRIDRYPTGDEETDCPPDDADSPAPAKREDDNRAVKELAAIGLGMTRDYDHWLHWRDASQLFRRPDTAQDCTRRAGAAVRAIDDWEKKTASPEA